MREEGFARAMRTPCKHEIFLLIFCEKEAFHGADLVGLYSLLGPCIHSCFAHTVRTRAPHMRHGYAPSCIRFRTHAAAALSTKSFVKAAAGTCVTGTATGP